MDDLTLEEQRIASLLQADTLPPIDPEDVERACRAASRYLNARPHPLDAGFWAAVFSAMSIPSALFWLIGAFALGMGARAAASFTDFSPMSLLFALSPVPIITLAIRELTSRDEGLAQIERACKYAPSRIYFARLWIGTLLNAVAITVLGALLVSLDAGSVRIWFCSYTAMFLVGAVALLAMSHLDHALPLLLLMAVWVACAAFAISQEEILSAIEQLSGGVLIVAILGSAAGFFSATLRASKRLYA